MDRKNKEINKNILGWNMKTIGSDMGPLRTLIYIANFAKFWKLSQVSPFPPFHDYQKYIPVKCTPRFSSLVP